MAKIDVVKIYIPHSLMVLLPKVEPKIVKSMPFSGFTGPSGPDLRLTKSLNMGFRSGGILTFMFFIILLTGYCEPIIFLVIYPVESSYMTSRVYS